MPFSYKLTPMFFCRPGSLFYYLILRLSLFSVFCFALLACQKPKYSVLGTEDTQIKIPVFENGSYQWKIVSLKTIDGQGEPKNKKYIFQVEPKVVNGRLQGKIHRWNFMQKKDGVLIPQDFLTLQMASITYHLEQLELMDQTYGSESSKRWPLDIGLQVRSVRGGKLEKNNASYEMNLHALVFQLSEGNNLPLYVNGGVIAHEYFHVLFSEEVLAPLKTSLLMKGEMNFLDHPHLKVSDPSVNQFPGHDSAWEQYHYTLLRGMNEGLADLWGYLYSQDDEFVGRSLPLYASRRKIDSIRSNIPTVSFLLTQMQTMNADQRIGLSYGLGNLTASLGRRMLEELQTQKGLSLQEAKNALGKAIVQNLPKMMKSFQKLQKSDYIAVSSLLSSIYANLGLANSFDSFVERKKFTEAEKY